MATRVIASYDGTIITTKTEIVSLKSEVFKLKSNTQEYQPRSRYSLKLFTVYIQI